MNTRSMFASVLCLLAPADAFRIVSTPGSLKEDVTGQTQAPCSGLSAQDFTGEVLTVTQTSTLYGNISFTYEITIGDRIKQTGSGITHLVGKHESSTGLKETFSNGDNCGVFLRSATVTYVFGPKLILVSAREPSKCKYEFVVQIPEQKCALRKADWKLSSVGTDLCNGETDGSGSTSLEACFSRADRAGVVLIAWTGKVYGGYCKVLKPSVTAPQFTCNQGYGYKLYSKAANFAGEYDVWYKGSQRTGATNTITCGNIAGGYGYSGQQINFDNVASKCGQPRDASASMYILNTHGSGKYECLWLDGTTIKGSHYTGPDSYWGTVEYRLKTATHCEQAIKCAENQHVQGNTCVSCPAGTEQAAGNDASGSDTACSAIKCVDNQHVHDHVCVPCPAGTKNAAGDDASGAYTMCDAVICSADQRVAAHACVNCPAGTNNAAGDDASGASTTCDAIKCLANQHVVAHARQMCPAGTENAAGDDCSGDDTTCDAIECSANQHVIAHGCKACPAGTTNAAGNDASGDDTACDAIHCAKNQHVNSNACHTCPAGTTNPADDDASGADTTCDSTMCAADDKVVSNECVGCPAGKSNEINDDASGTDTVCDAIMCPENQRVHDNACASCPAGTTNAAADDASGGDSYCDAITCAENQHVQGNTCVNCPAGTEQAAGNDASGSDTACSATCDGLCDCDQYQFETVVLACSANSGSVDVSLQRMETTSIVSIPLGAHGVYIKLNAPSSDIDLQLYDDGHCKFGYGCTHNLIGTYSYEGMSIEFSGDKISPPVVEFINITGITTRSMQLEVKSYGVGPGTVAFEHGVITPCPAQKSGCAACSSFSKCGVGETPTCDGSSAVTCQAAAAGMLAASSFASLPNDKFKATISDRPFTPKAR